MSTADERIPCAGEMRAWAAAFVARVTARNRLPLDYSVASLRVVGFLVDGLRKGGADREQARETLFGLGAYVGEAPGSPFRCAAGAGRGEGGGGW